MNRMIRLFIFLYLFSEITSIFALRFLFIDKSEVFKTRFWWVYWIWTIACMISLIYFAINAEKISDPKFMSTGFLLFSIVFCNVVFKFILSFFFLINILINWVFSWFSQGGDISESRRHFITQTGLALGSVALGGLLYGIIRGRYQFRTIKQTIKIPNLPDNWVGKTIVHISDMHLGSFPHKTPAVAKGIEKINALNPDYIFFTGDLVNERAIEAEPWIETVGKLKAKHGKYSSLGNHDYGDYYGPWEGKPDKIEENVQHLQRIHEAMGFQLLRNENVLLEQNGQTIRLIGMENWGSHGFSKYGNMPKAMEGVSDDEVQIMLSHDPTHWDEQVIGKSAVDLSLAGHTHGSQIGIEVPGFRWSPVEYFYPRWAGLYEVGNQKLYVNRGFGYIGYAGRIGIWPEITLIELQKA